MESTPLQHSLLGVDDHEVRPMPQSSEATALVRKKRSTFVGLVRSWYLEFAAWMLSAACVAAVVIVLKVFDGQLTPQWHYGITLNALVSTFVTIARVSLLSGTAEGISQLKWLWFAKKDRAMIDFHNVDKASRGTLGSVKLLFNPRFLSYVTVGAVIMVSTLVLEPITQQAINSELRPVIDTAGTASIARAANYSAFDPAGYTPYPDLDMQGAIYDGMCATSSIAPLPAHCSSGNCTFPPFETLGVCSSVADVSSYLEISCEEEEGASDSCQISIPNILKPVSTTVTTILLIPNQLDLPNNPGFRAGWNSTSYPLAFKDVDGLLLDYYTMYWNGFVPDVGTDNDPSDWTMIETALYFCVQTLQVNISQGVSTTWMTSEVAGNISATGMAYPYDSNSYLGMSQMLNNLFAGIWEEAPGGGAEATLSPAVTASVRALNIPPSGLAAVKPLALNMATSMSNMIRTTTSSSYSDVYYFAPPVNGHSYILQPYVVVGWPWLTALIVVDILAGCFLVLVVILTALNGTDSWKSSAIAVLRALVLQADHPSEATIVQEQAEGSDTASGIEHVKGSVVAHDTPIVDVRGLLDLDEMEKQAQELHLRLANDLTNDIHQDFAGLVLK